MQSLIFNNDDTIMVDNFDNIILLTNLPEPVLIHHIFYELDFEDLKSLRLTCKYFSKICFTNRKLFIRDTTLSNILESKNEDESSICYLTRIFNLNSINFYGFNVFGCFTNINGFYPLLNNLKVINFREAIPSECNTQDLSNLPSSLQQLSIFVSWPIDHTHIKLFPRSLTHLTIDNFSYGTDEAMEQLPLSLESIDFAFCGGITDEGFKHLGRFSVLKSLKLVDCIGITSKALQYLPLSLTSIDLHYEENFSDIITDKSLESLAQALKSSSSLTHLNLNYSCSITSKGLKYLPSTLKILKMAHCGNITDENIDCIPRNLEELDATNWGITDIGLRMLPSSLTKLHLDSCSGIKIYILFFFKIKLKIKFHYFTLDIKFKNINNLSLLKSLGLYNCKEISDLSIESFSSTLTDLDLSHCSKITDKTLILLPSDIKKLNLYGCSITNNGLNYLSSNLKYVKLSLNHGVTLDGLEELKKNPKFFSFIYTSNLVSVIFTNEWLNFSKTF
jgi:hypothetical protein